MLLVDAIAKLKEMRDRPGLPLDEAQALSIVVHELETKQLSPAIGLSCIPGRDRDGERCIIIYPGNIPVNTAAALEFLMDLAQQINAKLR